MRATCCVLAFAAALALAGAAQAQSPPAEPGPWRMHHAPSPEMQARREAHEQQRMADLRTVLRLRPDQEAALATFLKSHGGPPSADPTHDQPVAGPEAMTTPQRLDQMAQWQARRAAEAQRRTDAVKAFYAALSPEQQRVFDALMRLQGPHGHDGHMGRPGMEHNIEFHMGGPDTEHGHPPG